MFMSSSCSHFSRKCTVLLHTIIIIIHSRCALLSGKNTPWSSYLQGGRVYFSSERLTLRSCSGMNGTSRLVDILESRVL